MPADQTRTIDDVRARARAWVADDPDPATRDELTAVIDGADGDGDLRDRCVPARME